MSLDVHLDEDACPTCGRGDEVYWSNITHNLTTMAEKAGVYQACWRPDEIGATKAEDIIKPLERGIKLLNSNPGKFREFEAENGWGTYADFVSWLEQYLQACKDSPKATIRVSR